MRALAVVAGLGAALVAGCAHDTARAGTASAAADAGAAPVVAATNSEQAAAAKETPDAPFRAQPPAPAPAAPFRAPVPQDLILANGVHAYLVERHDVPLVAVALSVRSGADTDPAGRAGLSSFTLDMLDEGTPTRDAAAIAKGFEDLAARYTVVPDADSSALLVVALTDTLPKTLDIFADVALRPAFTEADLKRVKQERLGQIAQALDDPATVGQHVLSRVIFGEKHPWGFPAEGTVKSIQALGRKDLVAWHAGAFRPSNAAFFVVGDVTAAQLKPLLEERFKSWHESSAPKPRQRAMPKGGDRVVTVVDKPDAPQSQIWIGEVGVASAAPDVFPARVMNNILGGTFNSRLNGNLRTEHAYSYGAGSFFDTHREAGPFIAEAGVVSAKTAEALTEFLRELTRMQSGEVTDEELSDAKAALVHSIPARLASDEQAAQAYAAAWSHGLPADYYATYEDRVDAVTKADVAKAARDRLHPDKMAIVVVGPEAQIESGLAGLKVGRIEIRDANGEARKAASAAAKTK
jgi:predicted Zn-dependent peptidase